MRTSKWVDEWAMAFIRPLPDELWFDYDELDLDILSKDLLPYLKGMAKELLGDNVFSVMGGKHNVRKRRRTDKLVGRFLMKPGGEVKNDVIPLLSDSDLEKIGMSYIHRGVFFTLLLYRDVCIDGDKTKAGSYSETAVRCLALGTSLVQRMRNGGGVLPTDRYLKLQRVPRVVFSELDFNL